MTGEDRYVDGYLAGCATANGYMEAIDKELTALRVRLEVLEVARDFERKRAERAEAQMLTLAEENAEMLNVIRGQIAETMRLM